MLLGLLTGLTVMAAAVLSGLAIYVWRRRQAAAGLALAMLLLSAAWWATAYALELSATDLVARGRWGDLKYVGICLLSPAWLVYVLEYTGRGRLVTRRLLALLAVEPLVIGLVLVVPATHDQVRYYLPTTITDEIPVVGGGPAFWMHLVYAYALMAAGMVIFVRKMATLSREYRVAALVLVAAAVLPWVANLLYNLEIGQFARMDLTPFLLVFCGAVLVWGLFRERLLNLSTIAWRLIVATGTDGVVLRDAFGRICDVNPAGEHMLGYSRGELIGRELGVFIPVAALLGPSGDPNGHQPVDEVEIDVTIDGDVRALEVRRIPLSDQAGQPRSSDLVLMRDVTARRESEIQLHALLQERTRVAATLQASLRPTPLPTIPGCDLAARYEAAGIGHEVGGDFYDVFPLGARHWGIVLGDVSGKGAQAAATTSLVRYTLRTLALEDPHPSRVLTKLNTALLREGDPERFCTLVFAVCRPSDTAVDLQLSLAGHPPPLLRRRDGRVEPVGLPGSALGLFPDPHLRETSLQLSPGDELLLFTDGLTEARDGDDQFGAERVAARLSQNGGSPQPLLDQLVGAAQEHSHGALTDDVALLALKASG
ncbi:MAG: histidine kinase N-terminal 7TM domain-containing protein [Dermatophilaceae bacterium]